MSGKIGMHKYPKSIREEVIQRIKKGDSQNSLSREYGISRYAIQSWLKESIIRKQRVRKSAKTLQEYKYENKRLKMENKLLRDFSRSQKGSEAMCQIQSYRHQEKYSISETIRDYTINVRT